MCVDYGNLGAVLSWMALFFTDDARQDLLRFSGSFLHSFRQTFLGEAVRVQSLVFAGRMDDESQPQWVARGLRLPRELVVEMVDQDTTREFPM